MKRPFAKRLDDIQPFRVMKLLGRAQELAEQGHDVIHMEVGEPNFPTPEPIIKAGIEALKNGKTRYTSARGIPDLISAIAQHYAEHYHLSIDPERIFVTSGGSGALTLVSALLLNHGEGLLMTDPGYPCNRHFIKAFHGEAQLVPVDASTAYHLTPELVSENWQDNTRGALLASPSNPTGAIITPNQLSAVADTVAHHGGHMVVDEIYHGLTYEADHQAQMNSILAVDNEAFVINSFSKYFGMTGWRLGWLIVPEAAISDTEKLAQNLFICASSIAQHAALEAFSAESRQVMEAQRKEFARRRDFLVPALRELGFSIPIDPQGAFYVYAGLPESLKSSEIFCNDLLEKYYVAVTPGTDFGEFKADQHVRFTYAENLDRLKEAVARMATAINILS